MIKYMHIGVSSHIVWRKITIIHAWFVYNLQSKVRKIVCMKVQVYDKRFCYIPAVQLTLRDNSFNLSLLLLNSCLLLQQAELEKYCNNKFPTNSVSMYMSIYLILMFIKEHDCRGWTYKAHKIRKKASPIKNKWSNWR